MSMLPNMPYSSKYSIKCSPKARKVTLIKTYPILKCRAHEMFIIGLVLLSLICIISKVLEFGHQFARLNWTTQFDEIFKTKGTYTKLFENMKVVMQSMKAQDTKINSQTPVLQKSGIPNV